MNAKSSMQLSTLDNLFLLKEREVKQTIGNLQLNEVKEDNRFNAAVTRIKRQALLMPMTIGEPKITGNRQVTKQTPPNYRNMWGGPQNFNLITVEFPCTGSRELFDYRASGGSLSMANIYAPSSNSIPVEVQLEQLDKAEAISTAKAEMKTTIELIKQNNPVAEAWSARMAISIQQMADQKRTQLLDFYS